MMIDYLVIWKDSTTTLLGSVAFSSFHLVLSEPPHISLERIRRLRLFRFALSTCLTTTYLNEMMGLAWLARRPCFGLNLADSVLPLS